MIYCPFENSCKNVELSSETFKKKFKPVALERYEFDYENNEKFLADFGYLEH